MEGFGLDVGLIVGFGWGFEFSVGFSRVFVYGGGLEVEKFVVG